jgi:hypothetical protein
MTPKQFIASLRTRADYFESAEGGWRDDTAAFLREAATSFEGIAFERELLLNIVGSLPGHETSVDAMGRAYWNWREKMKDAIASARVVLQREAAR